MLRITVHEDDGQYRLELAGKLAGPWVAETESVWRLATCSGKEIEIDMRDVTGMDAAGRDLLSAMHQAGARLIARGVEMTALVDEITGNHPLDGTNHRGTRVVPVDQRPKIRRTLG